jgi:Ca2+-dependent lipid-binding protein
MYQRNQQERHAIEVDTDFDWTPDHTFNVSFTIKGKAKGFHIDQTIGIKELKISGTMSCLLSPLVDVVPCVGTGQMFFLDTPSVSFKLVGVNKLPDIFGRLLTSIMQHVATNVLHEGYILPHRYLHKVKKDLPLETLIAMKSPLPLGLLRIQILEAQNLPAADTSITGKKSSDPYVCVKIGFDQVRTTTIENTCDPKWNDPPGHLLVYNVAQLVRITVHDDDNFGTEMLGSVSGYSVYALCQMMKEAADPQGCFWLDVETHDRKPAGKLKIRLKYFEIEELAKQEELTPTMKARGSIEEAPYLLTVRLLGLECIQPGRGDLRNAQATVEIVPKESESTGTKSVHRHLKTGLQKGFDTLHKIRAATGIGFGDRQDGIPATRNSGKAVSWAIRKI